MVQAALLPAEQYNPAGAYQRPEKLFDKRTPVSAAEEEVSYQSTFV